MGRLRSSTGIAVAADAAVADADVDGLGTVMLPGSMISPDSSSLRWLRLRLG